ncbi:MAG: LEA type 2 family protein [Deltaproteobacteria bacterium]|nr:LEA type 2 family protein [Deltaproteobacteria bacterium]
MIAAETQQRSIAPVRSRVGLAAVAAVALALPACISVQLPVLTVRSADITNVSTSGLDLRVDIAAHNPNTYDVTINHMTVQCTLAEQDLGVVRDDQRRVLPAGQTVPMEANFRVPWSGLPGLLLSAVTSDQLPYRLEGVAIVEDGSYEVEYAYESYVSRSVFLGAATRAVAPMIPGGIDIRVGP